MANTPSTDNYTLGKGVVSFNRLNMATGLYSGERDLGNSPKFGFTTATTKLPHYSSRGGLKAKDKEIVIEISPTVAFDLEEVNADNFSLLTLGTINTVTQVAGSVTDELVTPYPGKMAQLSKRMIGSTTLAHGTVTDGPFVVGDVVTGGMSNATGTILTVGAGSITVAATGIFQNGETITSDATTPASADLTASPVFVSTVVVESVIGAVTYTAGTDYVIDTSLKDGVIGRIRFPEGTTIPAGVAVNVSYAYAATTYKVIQAFTTTQIEGFLRFVSDNPAGGNRELKVWRCSLTPSGETAMIGDNWSTLSFTGEILKDAVNHPDSPFMDVIELD